MHFVKHCIKCLAQVPEKDLKILAPLHHESPFICKDILFKMNGSYHGNKDTWSPEHNKSSLSWLSMDEYAAIIPLFWHDRYPQQIILSVQFISVVALHERALRTINYYIAVYCSFETWTKSCAGCW